MNMIAFTVRVIFSITCVDEVYRNIITSSCLQLINTSINTFFSKLHTVLADQRRIRKANDEARWHNELISADQDIRKSNVTVHNLGKIWRPASSGTWFYGRLEDKIWQRHKILKDCCRSKYLIFCFV